MRASHSSDRSPVPSRAASLRRTSRASPGCLRLRRARRPGGRGSRLARRHPADRATPPDGGGSPRRGSRHGRTPGGRPSRDGQPLAARSRRNARPTGRAASGTRRPARGGSRRSPLARRPLLRPFAPASPRRARAARRVGPSRSRRTRRRGSAGAGTGTRPPREGGAFGRISSFRTSAHQIRRHLRACLIRHEIPHGAEEEVLPHDRRRFEHRALLAASGAPAARRAAPGSMAGPSTAERSPVTRHRSPSRTTSPSSISIASVSSTNSGLPSALATMRRGELGRQLGRAEEVRHEDLGLFRRERLERHGRGVQLPAAPRRAGRRAVRNAPCTTAGSASRATSPRCARRGRGTWAHPNGRRRTPAPADGRAPRPRRTGGSPRRSPRRAADSATPISCAT